MVIDIKDVFKTYDTGKIKFTALQGINLNIEKGEFTSIMGPSGSGKSTLMNILGCLDRMTRGKYFLNGQDVSTLNDKELALIRNKEIGFVFQAFNLLPRLNILENVELPMIYAGIPLKTRIQSAKSALDKVGLSEWLKHKPNEISGGQKQRVAIARAIVNNPAVIMADEPTGNLDTKSSVDIMRIFQNLNKEGKTIIMVTHEADIAKHSKRIVTFKDGEILQDRAVEDRIKLV
ncbi:MAG: ABC transporter ATP-binding protein [Clostridiaceae bacterium]